MLLKDQFLTLVPNQSNDDMVLRWRWTFNLLTDESVTDFRVSRTTALLEEVVLSRSQGRRFYSEKIHKGSTGHWLVTSGPWDPRVLRLDLAWPGPALQRKLREVTRHFVPSDMGKQEASSRFLNISFLTLYLSSKNCLLVLYLVNITPSINYSLPFLWETGWWLI